MKNALMLIGITFAIATMPVAAEQLLIAPHLEKQATLIVIENDTLLTKKATRLFDEPKAKGFLKIVPPMTMLYPTGHMTDGWVEVDDDYDKYGPAGDRGWVRAADVVVFTEWKGN